MCGDGVSTSGGWGEAHGGPTGVGFHPVGIPWVLTPAGVNYNQLFLQLKHLKLQIHFDLPTNSDVK